MKYLKKLMMLVMVLAMVMTCLIPMAMAEEATGSITVNNAAIGKEYQTYKILDATYSGENIAYTTKTPALFKGEGSPWVVQETADASGNYSVTLAEGKTMADVNTWIAANLASFTAINPASGVGADNMTATADTVKWEGIPYGYYYITSGLGTVVTVDSVKPNALVNDKNETNPSGLEKVSDSQTAQIGDVVQFTVTFTATNYITDATENDGVVTATTEKVASYTVTDTADGFDYLIDATHPVTLKIGDNGEMTVAVTPVQQTEESTGAMTFDIPWVDADGNPLYQYSEEITITYYGVVNAYAYDGAAVNSISVSNDTEKDTLEASTTTNTYNLTVNKTDDKDQPLTGAKFELYRNDTNAAPVSLVDVTASVTGAAANTRYYRVAEENETGDTTIDLTEGTYSSAVIYGLDGADTYCVLETEAPKGYNKLENAAEHEMSNVDGILDIKNVPGMLLPSTGGMGTTLFYILGGIMVIGALVFLVTNKRMGKQ